MIHSDDLVGRLIADLDNQPIWKFLLTHPLVEELKTIGPDDGRYPDVLRAFKAYTVVSACCLHLSGVSGMSHLLHRSITAVQQDYRYAADGIQVYGDRFPDKMCDHPLSLKQTLRKLFIYSKYTENTVGRCLNKLDITEDQLAHPSRDDYVEQYFQDLLLSAEAKDWMMALVSFIPSIMVSRGLLCFARVV